MPVEETSKGNHMTIAVLLKQVPDTTAKISINGDRVDENAVSKWSFSPYDEYALEAALTLKESAGGEIVAITAGPARCEKLLRDAAAVGADTLIHVSAENINELDSTQVQKLLAAAVQKSGASVIFCGKQAADTNAGSTGPGVAELIEASCVTLVSEVSSDGGEFWNRLVFEGSPYLLQHAANPVNWYPWGEEAFQQATVLNKPIFLSIGYTTCHCCHVM